MEICIPNAGYYQVAGFTIMIPINICVFMFHIWIIIKWTRIQWQALLHIHAVATLVWCYNHFFLLCVDWVVVNYKAKKYLLSVLGHAVSSKKFQFTSRVYMVAACSGHLIPMATLLTDCCKLSLLHITVQLRHKETWFKRICYQSAKTQHNGISQYSQYKVLNSLGKQLCKLWKKSVTVSTLRSKWRKALMIKSLVRTYSPLTRNSNGELWSLVHMTLNWLYTIDFSK